MTGTLELYSDIAADGRNTVVIDPINPTSGQTYTLSLFDVEITFEATASTDNNVVAGLKAAIAASEDENWQNVTATIIDDDGNPDPSGDRLLLSYSTATGVTRIWRGDAPAVAQVTTVTPSNISAGDLFALIINGKRLEYRATASTASNVADGLLAAIQASDLPEFDAFNATASGGVLTLTAAEPGVPFNVTGDADSGVGLVTITQSQTAVAGVQRRWEWIVPDTFATFRVRYRGQQTSTLTTASVDAAALQTALNANSHISNSAATITTLSTARKFVVLVDDDGTDELPVISAGELIIAVTTTDAGPPEVQRLHFTSLTPGPATADATFTLTLDGYTTAPISYGADAAAVKNALMALPVLGNAGFADTVTVGTRTEQTISGQLSVTFDITFDSDYGNVTQLTAAWVVEPSDSVVAVTETQAGVVGLNTRYALNIDADAGTYTLTVDGQTTSNIAWNANAAAIVSALEALSTVDSGEVTVTGGGGVFVVEFVEGLAETNVVLTGNATGLVGSGNEALTIATPTASSGPAHWDTAANWSPVGVPADGDAVSIEFGNRDILYGLNQSGVLLTALRIAAAYTGRIGLPRVNPGGYYEYLLRDLTIGATQILIGHGDGGGSSKIQINTGADRTTIEVRATGGSSEPSVPAFTWRGSNTLNFVSVWGGDFGASIFSDQTSRIQKFVQRGGSATLNNCTLSEIDAPGQTLRAHNSNLNGSSIEL